MFEVSAVVQHMVSFEVLFGAAFVSAAISLMTVFLQNTHIQEAKAKR